MTAVRGSADASLRAEALAAARDWIGTPYVHGASLRGAGADCLGLVRGVWRTLYGREAERPPPYSADWGEATGDEALWRSMTRHCVEIAPGDASPGDVLLLRLQRDAPAKHLGICGVDGARRPTLVHAFSGRGVVESPFGETWARRVAAAFSFPGRD
jgi:NlpC/P60 family putative phage cell wall peptidase